MVPMVTLNGYGDSGVDEGDVVALDVGVIVGVIVAVPVVDAEAPSVSDAVGDGVPDGEGAYVATAIV